LTSAARTAVAVAVAAAAAAPCGGSAVVSGSWHGGSLVVQNGAERQLCSSPGVASAHGQKSHEMQQPQQRAPLRRLYDRRHEHTHVSSGGWVLM